MNEILMKSDASLSIKLNNDWRDLSKTLQRRDDMAKVRLVGDVNMEIEVKYGLSDDVVIRVHAIPVEAGGKAYRVLVGEGDISHIPDRTLDYIGEMIESLLRKNKVFVGFDGFGKFFRYGTLMEIEDDRELYKSMYATELGTLIMRAFRWQKHEALREVLERKLFPLSKSGMKEFALWERAKKKAEELGCPMETVKKVLI
jgi:hypothetical protein